jgi:hypothetical protein
VTNGAWLETDDNGIVEPTKHQLPHMLLDNRSLLP